MYFCWFDCDEDIGVALQDGLSLGFPTRSDANWAVQPQKMARGLKFQI